MKRAVVCLLLSMSMSSICISPTVAYATGNAEQDSGEQVSDKPTKTEAEQTSVSEAEQTIEKQQTPAPEKGQEEKADKPVEEDTNKKTEIKGIDLTLNEGLKSIKKFMKVPFDEEVVSGRYLLSKDLIYMGYNSEEKGKEGFLSAHIERVAPTVTNVSFGKVSDDSQEMEWGYLDNIKDMESLREYVKQNKGTLPKVSKNDLISFDLGQRAATSVLVFTVDGEYLGNLDVTSKDVANTLYDKNILGSPVVTVKSELSEDKSSANITSSYDFSSYPQQLGGEYLMNFEVRNGNGDLVLSSSDSLQYIGKGTAKFPISMNGNFVLSLKTNVRSIEKSFTVKGIEEPKQTEVSDRTPSISYSDLPNGVLKGTSYPITVYSDIDAVLMLEGESSGKPCKEHTFTISHNGTYKITATTESGAEITKSIKVDGFVDDVKDINHEMYGTERAGILPQTGGIGRTAVILSGLLCMLGGIILTQKERLLLLIQRLRKKVSKHEE